MAHDISDDEDEANQYAETAGIPFTVRVSPELRGLLKPNDFLSGLGIQYSDRVKAALGSLKGSLIPKKSGLEDSMPKGGVNIHLAIVQGPFIREELVSIRAEATDDGGEKAILLAPVPEEK